MRTHTDLATIEGANEAARRAVNALLDDEESGDDRCGVWPLREPEVFAPARALDLVLLKLGLDPRRPAEITPDGRVDRAGRLDATALPGADLAARLLRRRARLEQSPTVERRGLAHTPPNIAVIDSLS